MAQDISGVPPFDPTNRAEPRIGNASNALSLSSLLTKTMFCSHSLSVGPPGTVQEKERLVTPQRNFLSPFDPLPPATTVNIYTPILFNHDVTLGHHLNGFPSSVDPEPTIEAAPGQFGWITPELLDQSSDTVGIIKLTVESPGQTAPTVQLTFGAPYWEVPSWSNPGNAPDSLPIVLIAPLDENGAALWSTGANVGFVAESNADGFSLTFSQAAAAGLGGQVAYLQYMVIGTRVPEIPA